MNARVTSWVLFAIGVLATIWLLATEGSYRGEQIVCLVAVVTLVAFDRVATNGVKWLTFCVPFLVLLAVSDTIWSPTRGIVIQGMLLGALTALFAVGLALIFRANRIVNFAQGDLGAVPALLAILLMSADRDGSPPNWITGQPYLVAFGIGLAGAILLGFVVERTFINRFNRGPRLILTVATIGIAQLLTALALFMPRWFGFGGQGSSVPDLDPPFDIDFEIGGVVFNDNDLMVFIAVPILLAALALFMRYTRVGIAVRAAAARADRAATLGVPVSRIQSTVWVIATVLAFVTVFLRAGVVGVSIGSAFGILVLVRAIAAAVIGRMDNFARIAAAALGIGVLEQAIVYNTGRDLYVFPVLFVVVVVALAVARPRDRGSRVEDQEVSNWQAAREVRPIPTELRSLPIVRNAQIALYLIVALFIVSLPFWMSDSKLLIANVIGIISIIAVSLVLLTGWAGHVSLGQLAFAAVGGAVGGYITQDQGWDLGIALIVGGITGALLAVVIGIPAARAGGLTLAITTLALAPAVLYWLLNPEFFEWVPRGRFRSTPELLGRIELKSQTSYYVLILVLLGMSIAAAYGIRRSRTGRVLIALRENPRAAESYGINVLRTQLAAFAMSGFLAAMAGVLYVHHAQSISTEIGGSNPFSAEASLRVFTIVVIGGLASIPGAILGTIYVFGMQYYMLPEFRFLATGIGLLLILLVLPGGLGAGLSEVRDAGLRWIAKRRNIIVPSLVADRRDPSLDLTPAQAAAIASAVADAVDRPEIEEVAEMRQ